MDGFLEADRIVEASLSKLGRVSKNYELPLRKALFVSKTLIKAQDAAETVQNSLIKHENCVSRGSSKLLASMKCSVSFEEDMAVSPLDLHSRSNQKFKQQAVSPIVLSTSSEIKEKEEDAMEYIPRSVISDLLLEDDMECCGSDRASSSAPWTSALEIQDSSRRWYPSLLISDSRDTSPPPSPVKRQHNVAFEEDKSCFVDTEDTKRFKFSSCDYYAESLPGFCDHLSPKNLCSAPLITYMFGKGFGVPSNPTEMDWPRSHSQDDSLYSMSPSKLLPVLAY